MDKQKIEFLLKVEAPVTVSDYAYSVADILKAPKWYQPIKRYKFNRSFVKRVNYVMAEYATEVIKQLK